MSTPSSSSNTALSRFSLPLHGARNPGREPSATTPGSFALAPDVGGPLMFASPDTPAMPAPSDKTAWDFLPDAWTQRRVESLCDAQNVSDSIAHDEKVAAFAEARGGMRVVTYPASFTPVTQLEHARLGIVTPEMRRVAQREPHFGVLFPSEDGGRAAEAVRDEVAAGRMVIPANINHLKFNLDPMCIGRASRTKVNANMGASPVSSGTDEEVEKLKWAEKWGADTVMDLSTGGDLDACREAILRNSTVPIGTVPIYSMIIGRRIEDLDWSAIEETLHHQAQQGVDYFTIHAGVRRAHLKHVKNRLIGIVSRGGSLLAKWMLVHGKENIMYDRWDDICDILRQYDVTFSIGDGLRPGGLADATDAAQLAELETLGELTERAWRKGVQVMIEGPGHVPFDQIEYNAKIQRTLCHGAPFYVLGPLVTDIFPGYDHITSCIGATAMAYHGAAMLCYVTPKEHLGLPKKDDVKQGCIAYKIAAHAADVALGIPGTRDRDDELTKARAALNWEKHFELSFDPDTARAYHDEDLDVDTDFCAMCGHDWCSVRISKEIQEFASGKADGFERMGGADGRKAGAPVKSAALTPEQQEILAKRGVLSPDEIHKLASKTKKAMQAAGTGQQASGISHQSSGISHQASAGSASANAESRMPNTDPRSSNADSRVPNAESPVPGAQSLVPSKLSCHSDYVDPDEARRMQREKGATLVQVDVRPAMGIAKEDRVV
ncbi:MAG: phosphomethylpyrimidine synthase ThiC [Phycisphaerales bacterium]|nr:phosphomethylpyrimidine synthase ThiC [Phycisphaerales bacterium]